MQAIANMADGGRMVPERNIQMNAKETKAAVKADSRPLRKRDFDEFRRNTFLCARVWTLNGSYVGFVSTLYTSFEEKADRLWLTLESPIRLPDSPEPFLFGCGSAILNGSTTIGEPMTRALEISLEKPRIMSSTEEGLMLLECGGDKCTLSYRFVDVVRLQQEIRRIEKKKVL